MSKGLILPSLKRDTDVIEELNAIHKVDSSSKTHYMHL